MRESVNELVDHTVASIAGGRLERASDIVMLRASELARAIKCRDVSCCEMMQAHPKHIDRLNPIVHALRLGVEQAELIALAHHRDTQLRRGEYLGWMHGLPTVIGENRDAAACALVAIMPPPSRPAAHLVAMLGRPRGLANHHAADLDRDHTSHQSATAAGMEPS